ncbi:MAG TPA: P1 family peptidase [Hypericibacter adhaerens]|uniref:Aminopeptidase n=1 Tax=Hypericibacter adhaerens TaxID=2602016 RepID=A0A5J6N602_9PROT|nr:P1 family peptidase [Hypericibacter adhaerens]QEX22396.1 aminopeptidase [Hypericibacter adhaerens]HWA45965.1 P1 family peptidase [Hypericibacter adhaerens]
MTARPASEATPSGKPRARALGIPFAGTPGPLNAITDLPGLAVGYETLIRGEGALHVGQGPVRTGVTAILPRGRDGVGDPCAAGMVSFNGNGEMTGTAWIEETGSLDLPILITNTHSVGACHMGAIEWTVRNHPKLAEAWLLPVVGETWDGYLNDINGAHVKPEHAILAIDAARAGPIEEGSVGGGTGMNCYAFKGGNGTASRLVEYGPHRYIVGAFVQANFGSRHELTVAGVPVGRALADDNPMESRRLAAPAGAGSVIAMVATNAPLLPGQCKAMARRIAMGLARTGTTSSHFSGDLFLAFSTANRGALKSRFPEGSPGPEEFDTLRFVPWGRMDPFYAAAAHAIEEAVVNALVANETMIGRDGHRTPALPHDRLVALLREHRAIA